MKLLYIGWLQYLPLRLWHHKIAIPGFRNGKTMSSPRSARAVTEQKATGDNRVWWEMPASQLL